MLLTLLAGFAAMWTLVAPTGELYDVADEAALSNLCKSHALHVPNMRHHVGLIDGNGTSLHVQGWQTMDKVQWLQRAGCSEFVPVLGAADHFMQTVAAARKGIDMPFTSKKLREHLAHARKHGPGKCGSLSMFKWRVVEPPSDCADWIGRFASPPSQPETPTSVAANTADAALEGETVRDAACALAADFGWGVRSSVPDSTPLDDFFVRDWSVLQESPLAATLQEQVKQILPAFCCLCRRSACGQRGMGARVDVSS